MVNRYSVARVILWGKQVGAVSWDNHRDLGFFEYDKAFANGNLNIAPLIMPLKEGREGCLFSFENSNKQTFYGLPGMLADAMPDKFGNTLINKWLASQGREPDSFNPVERLCYMGKRAMGALEFRPVSPGGKNTVEEVDLSELASLAHQAVLVSKGVGADHDALSKGMAQLIKVGTSAGGARSKAVIAMDKGGNFLSGQGVVPEDYEHWLLKFDGVEDVELGESQSFCRIEYAYYLMALTAGVTMSESRLLEEGGRAHFMTKRFDRVGNEKVFMQTLCGVAHCDYNMAGAYSYEQAFNVMRKLDLTKDEANQQYLRMVFNVLAKNLDDHTKNISFLMGKDGKWSLSPAYDVTYAHNPAGVWTSRHQMSVCGKRECILLEDLVQVGESIGLDDPAWTIRKVAETVGRWEIFAARAGLSKAVASEISEAHRSGILGELDAGMDMP